ncbi:MAG: bifunctional oligoribonuclease/PAP phosphatase NrnA [Phycisphaerae bacterium]
MTPPPELIDALNAARRPLIVGHVTPDADAVGSMLALARALPSGAAAVALDRSKTAQKLRFMIDLAGVPSADAARIAEADVVAVVDTAGTNRVNVEGKWEAVASKVIVNIDHHITNPDFGAINWVVDSASSTCELIARLIAAAGWPLDATTASLLYAGIHSDTGGFSLPNATAEALHAAADLVRAGADVEKIGAQLCRSQRRSEFDLIRVVYRNTHLADGGRIAYSTLSHEDIHSAGCTAEDIDDQVSIPRSLSGVRIAMLFSEGEPGVVRINFRGEDGTPVLPLAQKLGGGGHTYSAGTRIRQPMDVVVERVLAEAIAALNAM